MKKESVFLFVASAGLMPIALSYGFSPQSSMPYLFDIDASSINSAHIFRAVMGLYLAMIVFWIAGARKETLTLPALWSLSIFMVGLAAGRALGLVIDGMPHPLLVTYLLLELGFAAVGFYFAMRYQPT